MAQHCQHGLAVLLSDVNALSDDRNGVIGVPLMRSNAAVMTTAPAAPSHRQNSWKQDFFFRSVRSTALVYTVPGMYCSSLHVSARSQWPRIAYVAKGTGTYESQSPTASISSLGSPLILSNSSHLVLSNNTVKARQKSLEDFRKV
jgi:hypothetical protein